MIHISKDNSKIGCPSFSIPSGDKSEGGTCSPNLACHKYCYAKKLERIYSNVKTNYQENYEESLKVEFVEYMCNKIKMEYNPRYFRIHVGGDFYNEEYAKKWCMIASKVKDTIFYGYTKSEFMAKIERPKNLILYWSVDGIVNEFPDGNKKGFDGVSYTSDEKSNCPNQANKLIKCGLGCTQCMKPRKKPLIFSRH